MRPDTRLSIALAVLTALSLAFIGNAAGAASAYVRAHCYNLEPVAGNNLASADLAEFVVEEWGAFVAGSDAHAQGLYYMSEIAGESLDCPVGEAQVKFQVLSYSKDDEACSSGPFENYQLEVSIGNRPVYRSAEAKSLDCGEFQEDPFLGSIRVRSYGVEVCKRHLMGLGDPLPPTEMSDEEVKEFRRAREAWQTSNEPSEFLPTANYKLDCASFPA